MNAHTPEHIALPQRFWSKVDKGGPLWEGTPCWLWQAARTSGYGFFWWQGRMRYAHQLIYLASVGSIPDGLEIDHLCRNTACVNPAHLEAVTRSTNLRRGLHTKRSWPACALCADPDGRVPRGVSPWRISGARFGVAGVLCVRCYNRLQMRARYRQKATDTQAPWRWREEDRAYVRRQHEDGEP